MDQLDRMLDLLAFSVIISFFTLIWIIFIPIMVVLSPLLLIKWSIERLTK